SFHLLLRSVSPDAPPFHKGLAVLQDGDVQVVHPHHFLYEGYAQGDVKSAVYGSLFDGVFDGHIYLSDGSSFMVERMSKYASNKASNFSYHSVISFDNQV
ncbi:hypothetical protein PMAYCL1PPCAC_27989, partial [Pristionchus mayeri]